MRIDYYDKNAETFIVDTINIDMSEHYAEFLSFISDNALLLDAGSGSGRDSLAFKKLGHSVVAIDSSEKMVRSTKLFADVESLHTTFESYRTDLKFDGIWACASLLHVKKEDLVAVLDNFSSILSHKGIIYVSFKYGDRERIKGTRYFNDLNEELLKKFVQETKELTLKKIWVSGDERKSRISEQWLNGILCKK